MHIPDWKTEKHLTEKNYQIIIGVDEVGRGPLAGPVVACAAVLRDPDLFKETPKEDLNPLWDLVRDSKSVSEKQREKVFEFIQEHFYIGVGQCDSKTIDDINILQASLLSMKKAYGVLLKQIPETLFKESKSILLVDGDKKIPNFSQIQIAVPRGDKKVKTIAAASIIAKVTRDRLMIQYAKEFPVYGFERHKGYGTKLHMEALHKYGASHLHRISFKPVRGVLDNRAINRELESE